MTREKHRAEKMTFPLFSMEQVRALGGNLRKCGGDTGRM
jgi:hypothetical protein